MQEGRIPPAAPVIRFDAQLMAEDMAGLGLRKNDLARLAGVADMTVIRFLRGEFQTAATNAKLARALGRQPARYILSARRPALAKGA